MHFKTILIDLDDTIYDNQNGLWNAIRDRLTEYMHDKLGFSWEEIPAIRHSYFETYGTTLRGLQIHHQVDPDDYLSYVHDIPLESYLLPDPELKILLNSLPQNKYIFTNSDAGHASRVLKALDVIECFIDIIDIRALEYHCKPNLEAFQRALGIAKVTQANQCIYIDDLSRNLAPARQLGLFTILISKDETNTNADLTIPTLKELQQAMPDLWFEEE